jgi:NADH dehydrogenase
MTGKKVVIAGMGFGGLRAAKELSGRGFDIIMVDRHNYHLFQPLLYQVATAGLEQESIAYPFRALARRWRGTSFRMAVVTGVDLSSRQLLLEGGSIPYDYLIMAAGSRSNFFGIESIEEHAFDLKTLSQAEELRNQILLHFEKASREADPVKRKAILTFVVVGGGPTGVEFAGALRELIVQVLSADYPEIKTSETKIILIEAVSSLLTAMPADLQEYAVNKLMAMGVEVRLDTKVTGADAEHVYLDGGEVIDAHILFWSAGVQASELAAQMGVPQGGGGRVKTLPDLSIEGHPEVFVIGDMAFVIQDEKPLPMMAPVATQQGQHAARNIMNMEQGKVSEPFHYADKGAMATIGRNAAVAVSHGFKFRGYIAWLIWLLLHLYYLIGFRNRILVLLNWAYYYFFHERQVRLITEDIRKTI